MNTKDQDHSAAPSQEARADRGLIRQAFDALETAHTGLMWYRGMMPEYVDGSDHEADEEITSAIEALRAALAPEVTAASDTRHCGNCADGVPGGPDKCSKCGREQQYSHWTPRFERTYCSQCGGEFGPGNEGFSHCEDHRAKEAVK